MTASTTAFPVPGLLALRRLTWWVTVACLLVFAVLVTTVSTVLIADVLAVAVCAAAGVLFAAPVLGRAPLHPTYRRGLMAAAVIAADAVLVVSRAVAEGGYPWPLPLAAVLAAAHASSSHPWRIVWPVGLSLALAASLLGSTWEGLPSWSGAVQDAAIVALGAWGLLAQVWMLRVAERLDRARQLESAAAVTGERLRFAADLHDIQGHSLQVIALKSELAERLAATDPERAVAEMREVQDLARQTLGDTRAVVHGYRQVTLETEMNNAARVLAAAGIDCRIERGVDLPELPPGVAALVGLVVREGTTNVLRHSMARRCTVALTPEAGAVRLRMSNDAPHGDRPGPAGGLATLADRLAEAGGALHWRVMHPEHRHAIYPEAAHQHQADSEPPHRHATSEHPTGAEFMLEATVPR